MTLLPEAILESRRRLPAAARTPSKEAAEGGCGVIGLASTVPIEGRHILRSCAQMRNRGNGKGGGVCAVGLDPKQWGVDAEMLGTHTLLQIAYLDPSVRAAVEAEFVRTLFDVAHEFDFPHLEDHREIPGLEVRPPDVRVYFARTKPKALDEFIRKSSLEKLEPAAARDEMVYQNSYRLNHKFYASLGQKAFVLSHAADMAVFKIVGYAEEAVRYYRLDALGAHVWIGHQRYPTKGRVWHPGGAHPFIGMHEALVHNGDFANYARVRKYLQQRRIHPLFLTDTEVAALLFDLWTRVYRYPLEYAIEAMAPTTERDFSMLPPEKRKIYRALQIASIKGSPDGPWFFILARNAARDCQLIGITDTSMLRPQVFAVQNRNGNRIGFIASEKQAIDAMLESLAGAGYPFEPPADHYWNARGGSYRDGGSFVFTVRRTGRSWEPASLSVTDKFGRELELSGVDPVVALNHRKTAGLDLTAARRRVAWKDRRSLEAPEGPADILAVDGSEFPPEGLEGLGPYLARAHRLGWRKMTVHRLRGQRFIGCGLGPGSSATIELYGSPGDYLGSGLDGSTLIVHNNAQDQVGQIMKSGRLVVHGDVGQTFLYGAKGGDVYVLGNAAGRPLINAVGKPRVVINGTCLDYLAESFMAGDALHGGGFVVLNAVRLVADRTIEPLETPYPGGNLFSLASGGAIFIRDPERRLGEDQLNGGQLEELTSEDWDLIRPYLDENERLFGVPVEALLTHSGRRQEPPAVYRKVAPTKLRALVLAHD